MTIQKHQKSLVTSTGPLIRDNNLFSLQVLHPGLKLPDLLFAASTQSKNTSLLILQSLTHISVNHLQQPSPEGMKSLMDVVLQVIRVHANEATAPLQYLSILQDPITETLWSIK